MTTHFIIAIVYVINIFLWAGEFDAHSDFRHKSKIGCIVSLMVPRFTFIALFTFFSELLKAIYTFFSDMLKNFRSLK